MDIESKYFTLEDFTRSQMATRLGIDNTPDRRTIASISDLCANVLDHVYDMAAGGIAISSGYRSPALNQALMGSRSSQHMLGEAADIYGLKLSVDALYLLIKHSGLPYDQLIHEFGRWIHISYGPKQRRQSMKAIKENGYTRYIRD